MDPSLALASDFFLRVKALSQALQATFSRCPGKRGRFVSTLTPAGCVPEAHLSPLSQFHTNSLTKFLKNTNKYQFMIRLSLAFNHKELNLNQKNLLAFLFS